MKKILCFILALTMIVSFAACAKSGGQEETSGTPQEETAGETEAVQEETGAETEAVQEETAAGPASETEAPQTQEAVEAGSDDTQPEAAALIVYFSWSGNTESVANEIQAQTGADIFKIVPETPYTDDYETLLDIAQEEQAADARPAIRDTVENFDQYDVVYLGYPNWWGDMPMILYTFLDEYDFSGKTIAPFVTSGGSGFSNTISTIESLEPEAAVTEGLSLGSSAAAQPESQVAEWLEAIGLEDRNQPAAQ